MQFLFSGFLISGLCCTRVFLSVPISWRIYMHFFVSVMFNNSAIAIVILCKQFNLFICHCSALERCNNTNPTCGILRQDNIPRPGETVRLEFFPSQALIDNPKPFVTYWINKTSNNYIRYGANVLTKVLTIMNVGEWMRGEEYYVQCTVMKDLNKCTQTVALEIKGTPFYY